MTKLLKGLNTIGVKWIYKTKYNERGEVDKHKDRLIAKGYSKSHGNDFNEVFALVSIWGTIRTILAVVANQRWCEFQLDVNSAFLHGELNEGVYISQHEGYHKGKSELVYKLKKALYGLRQAPRVWYSRIKSYFSEHKFLKCPYKHTLFVKHGTL